MRIHKLKREHFTYHSWFVQYCYKNLWSKTILSSKTQLWSSFCVAAWLSGNTVLINVVALRRARLVLRWVIVRGYTIFVFNQIGTMRFFVQSKIFSRPPIAMYQLQCLSSPIMKWRFVNVYLMWSETVSVINLQTLKSIGLLKSAQKCARPHP